MRTARSDKLIRCAVYTRKSHEEGLEQEFNSLDAQRESAEAYIKSQLHEGWQLINNKYDDGGFSGGNMKRPALTQLLDDIRYNKIDIVVVYKVDRLSRSLSDFSRLIELFDEHGVSFVSVTQQFNTSNSMGRLTLNMLLSFAQFEREVTGERIRDKIEASKKKGLWMGGNPPMGYAVEGRRLVVLSDEAAFVKRCFENYLSTPSILILAQTFNDEGYRTKYWVSQKGKAHGGKRLSPKYIYRMLTNPVYRGQIAHKAKQYDGQHDAIIEQKLWEKVQKGINKKLTEPKVQTESPYLLKGKFKHHEGFSMSPSTFRKKHKDSTIKETRYYVSQKAIKQGYKSCDVKSINAGQIEGIILATLIYLLISDNQLTREQIERLPAEKSQTLFQRAIEQVVISSTRLTVDISKKIFNEVRIEIARLHAQSSSDNQNAKLPLLVEKPKIVKSEEKLFVALNIDIKNENRARSILGTDGTQICRFPDQKTNTHILKVFQDAYRWRRVLNYDDKKTAKQLAKDERVNYSLMLRKLTLLSLAPQIQKELMTGELGQGLQLKALLNHANNLSWFEQGQQMKLKP